MKYQIEENSAVTQEQGRLYVFSGFCPLIVGKYVFPYPVLTVKYENDSGKVITILAMP
jgi:hypothetical protein